MCITQDTPFIAEQGSMARKRWALVTVGSYFINYQYLLSIPLNIKIKKFNGKEGIKLSRAINFCLQYHKIDSRHNTVANYQFVLEKFEKRYQNRDIHSINTKEVITFLAEVSEGRKQNIKRCRYSTLSAFFNLVANSLLPKFSSWIEKSLSTFCRKIFFKKYETIQWNIF